MIDKYLMAIRDLNTNKNDIFEVNGYKLLEAITEYFENEWLQANFDMAYTVSYIEE